MKTAITNAWRGDTIKLPAGRIIAPGSNPIIVQARPAGSGGSGYLTITTTEDARLPVEGTRITPTYLQLLPTIQGGSIGMRIIGSSSPAENVKLRGLHFTGVGGFHLLVGGRGSDGVDTSTKQPDDISVEQCIFTQPDWITSGVNGFVFFAPRNIGVLRDSWFAGAYKPGAENQSILMANFGKDDRAYNHERDSSPTDGRALIINNYIADNCGENIMSGGVGPGGRDIGGSGEIAFNALILHPERMRTTGWSANTYVFKGKLITANGDRWRATASGQTGSSAPTWPGSGSVNDGGTNWARLGTSSVSGYGVKNVLECKNCNGFVISRNLMQGMWVAGQYELAINKTSNYPDSTSVGGQCVPGFSGTVNVSGTTVTSADGRPLPNIQMPDQTLSVTITINGTSRTIASFDSPLQLTLASSGGSLSGASYTYGRADCRASFNLNSTWESNIFRRAPMGMQVSQYDNALRWRSQRPRVRNNLTTDIDINVYGTGGLGGYANINQGPPGFQYVHNTTVRAPAARTAGFQIDWGNSRVINGNTYAMSLGCLGNGTCGQIKNNIWPKSNGAGIIGTTQLKTDGDQSLNFHLCGGGTCTATQWNKNILAGVALGNYTTGTSYNLCSSSASCNVDWNYDNDSDRTNTYPLFAEYNQENWKVRPGSIAAKNGTDNRDIGARFDDLPLIHDLTITPLDNKALMTYRVSPSNKHIPCVVEVSTQRDLSWDNNLNAANLTYPFIADLNPANYTRPDTDEHDRHLRDGVRRMILLGKNSALSASTTYFFRLHCGGDLKEEDQAGNISFTTTSSISGTSSLGLNFRAPATENYRLEYGYTFSRATDSVEAATGYSACTGGAQCSLSATVNRGEAVVYRWHGQTSGRNGPWQVQAIQ